VGTGGYIFSEVKRLGHEADHSSLPIANVCPRYFSIFIRKYELFPYVSGGGGR
jgi:hypothetical protein